MSDLVDMMSSGLEAFSNPFAKLLTDIAEDSSPDDPDVPGPYGGSGTSSSAEF